MRLTAGGVRELRWHSADEWAIVLTGNARITAIDSEGRSFATDTKKYDLWYFPSGIPRFSLGEYGRDSRIPTTLSTRLLDETLLPATMVA